MRQDISLRFFYSLLSISFFRSHPLFRSHHRFFFFPPLLRFFHSLHRFSQYLHYFLILLDIPSKSDLERLLISSGTILPKFFSLFTYLPLGALLDLRLRFRSRLLCDKKISRDQLQDD